MTQSNCLRWGVLSTANIGLKALIPALQAYPGAELCALASRDAEKAERYAKLYHIPKTYDSYEALIQDPDIGVVYNPLPNHLHMEWTIKAIEAGKHVLCEKPLALDAPQAQRMLEAAQQHGVLLMEAFMYRYHPQHRRVQALLKSGFISAPRLIRSCFSFPLLALGRPGDIRWQAGGGSLMDLGCYCVNVSRCFFAAEPLSVLASAIVHPDYPQVDAQFHAVLNFSGERVALVDCGFLLPNEQAYELVGSDGRIWVEEAFNPGGAVPVTINAQKGNQRISETIPPSDRYRAEVEYFCDCIHNGVQPETGAQDGLNNMKVIDALLRSARLGQTVTLDEG